jgi:hypothetical protein
MPELKLITKPLAIHTQVLKLLSETKAVNKNLVTHNLKTKPETVIGN